MKDKKLIIFYKERYLEHLLIRKLAMTKKKLKIMYLVGQINVVNN